MHHMKLLRSVGLAAFAVVMAITVGYTHDEVSYINAPEGYPAPTLELRLHVDPISGGYNAQLVTTNWQYTGPYVNQAPIPNSGHAHLYLDGVKVNRLYSNWYYMGEIHPGLHEVRATLNANDHREWAVNGEVIEDVVILNIEDASLSHEHGTSAGHSHSTHFDVALENPVGFPVPQVYLEVFEDAVAGWNLHLQTTNFNFAPERVSTTHVYNEGHAHVYVDGVRGNRIYGNWYHLGNLEPGLHTIEVHLATNDHREYMNGGVLIASSVSVLETRSPDDAGHTHGDEEEHDHGDDE